MIDIALLNYIRRQLKLGHSAEEVKEFLQQKGYNEEIVNQHLEYVYHSKSRSRAGISIVIIVIILVLVIGILSYYMFLSKPEQSEITLTLKLDKTTFKEDDIIQFHRQLNKITGTSAEVKLTHTLLDNNANVIHSVSEEVTIYNQNSKEIVLGVLYLEPGIYSISTDYSYDGNTKTESGSFIVEEVIRRTESCFDGVQNQGEEGIDCGGPCKACIRQCPIFYDDQNPCTIDKCGSETNFKVIHIDIVPCCGNNVCESQETKIKCPVDCENPLLSSYFNTSGVKIIDDDMPLFEKIKMIKVKAKTNVEEAMELCGSIVFPYYQDECFYGVAEEAEDHEICKYIQEETTKDKCYKKLSVVNEDSSQCARITSDVRRDSCYMRFALKGDFTVCDKIQDDFYIQSCMQLEGIAKRSPSIIEEYSSNIE